MFSGRSKGNIGKKRVNTEKKQGRRGIIKKDFASVMFTLINLRTSKNYISLLLEEFLKKTETY